MARSTANAITPLSILMPRGRPCGRCVHSLLLGPPGGGHVDADTAAHPHPVGHDPRRGHRDYTHPSCRRRTGDRTALVTTRPCHAPHHTISDVGLIGGGHVPMPGDVSRAHNHVLFLDELPEFRRHVVEV